MTTNEEIAEQIINEVSRIIGTGLYKEEHDQIKIILLKKLNQRAEEIIIEINKTKRVDGGNCLKPCRCDIEMKYKALSNISKYLTTPEEECINN